MDIYFTLFTLVVALAAAVGFSLLLVGYMTVMPASFAHGKIWLRWVALVPSALLGIPLFIDAILVFFGVGIRLSLVLVWLGIPAMLIHAGALSCFLFNHWSACRKPGQQLAIGLALLTFASALLYGAGPMFASRILAGLK